MRYFSFLALVLLFFVISTCKKDTETAADGSDCESPLNTESVHAIPPSNQDLLVHEINDELTFVDSLGDTLTLIVTDTIHSWFESSIEDLTLQCPSFHTTRTESMVMLLQSKDDAVKLAYELNGEDFLLIAESITAGVEARIQTTPPLSAEGAHNYDFYSSKAWLGIDYSDVYWARPNGNYHGGNIGFSTQHGVVMIALRVVANADPHRWVRIL